MLCTADNVYGNYFDLQLDRYEPWVKDMMIEYLNDPIWDIVLPLGSDYAITKLAEPISNWPGKLTKYKDIFRGLEKDWTLMKRKNYTTAVEQPMSANEGKYFVWMKPGGPIAWWELNVRMIYTIEVKIA